MSDSQNVHVGRFSHLDDNTPTSVQALARPDVLIDTNKRSTYAAFQKYREIFDLIYGQFHPTMPPKSVSLEIQTHLKMTTVLVEIRFAYKAYCENYLGLRGQRWPVAYDFQTMQEAWKNTQIKLARSTLLLTSRSLLTAVKLAPAVTHAASLRLPVKDDPNATASIVSYADHQALHAIGVLITKRLWPLRTPVVVQDAPDHDTLTRFMQQYDVAVMPNDDGTFNLM